MTSPDSSLLRNYLAGQVDSAVAAEVEAYLRTDPGALAALERVAESAAADDLGLRLRALPATRLFIESSHPSASTAWMAGRSESPVELPERLGEYRVIRVIGSGGMGIVLEAEDTRLGRRVAIKVMRPGIAALRDSNERFLSEARAAAVAQDHVVPIYHIGETDGVPYLVMPLLVGETLAQRLAREQRLSPTETVRIGFEVYCGWSGLSKLC